MYARKNLLKEKLEKGQKVLGMELWLRDPHLVELLGHAGYDFVHIESEHVGQDWTMVENFVRAAELYGMTPLYRTEQCFDNEPPVNEIIKALSVGAQIIMVPQVSTAEAARKAVLQPNILLLVVEALQLVTAVSRKFTQLLRCPLMCKKQQPSVITR